MEKYQKVLIGITCLPALASIVLTVVSIASDNWVESQPWLYQNGSLQEVNANKLNFGLFKGFRYIDFGIALRESSLKGNNNLHLDFRGLLTQMRIV